MFKILTSFNNYSPRVLRTLVPSYAGMLRVKAGRPLVNHFLKMVLLVKGSIETSLVKVTVSYVRFLVRLFKANGVAYVAKYLKASVTLMMQALSGEPHKDPRVLGITVSRTRRGIPRFIPAIHRRHIRNGNLFYIRLWLSLMSFYRVLDFVGKLNIKTIITPSSPKVDFTELREVVGSYWKGNIFDRSLENGLEKPRPFWISSSSPNSTKAIKDGNNVIVSSGFSTSIGSIVQSMVAYGENKTVMRAWLNLSAAMGFQSSMVTAISFSRFSKRYMPNPMWLAPKASIRFANPPSHLGKLAFKIEPAGKIRVFAMVDCFTQWLLEPIHSACFTFLKSFKRDATFDQTKVLNDFVNDLKSRGITRVFSFDLSSATDRLPLTVQSAILSALYGTDLGEPWASLLVDRWYQIPYPEWNPAAVSCRYLGIDPHNPGDNIKVKWVEWKGRRTPFVDSVRYATGQPMGALSSWAMLAITHHTMVRIAARRAGMKTFDLYLVLGDDLVIADTLVAEQYLKLAQEWCVDINLSKSVISRNGSLEFAKRFFYKYQDVSGLSFKEMAVAYYDVRGLFQLLNRIQTFRSVTVAQMLSFLGHGYKALSRITARYSSMSSSMARTLLLASFPGLLFSKFLTKSDWLGSTAFNRAMLTNWPDSVLEYLKELVLNQSDKVKQSTLPRTPEEFRIEFHKLYGYSGTGPQIPYIEDEHNAFSSFMTTIERAVMPMFYDIQESWDSTVVEVKDTYEFAELEDFDVDSYWEAIETLEDISSKASNASPFRVIKDVITLGNSSLLRRAKDIRSQLSRFTKEKM